VSPYLIQRRRICVCMYVRVCVMTAERVPCTHLSNSSTSMGLTERRPHFPVCANILAPSLGLRCGKVCRSVGTPSHTVSHDARHKHARCHGSVGTMALMMAMMISTAGRGVGRAAEHSR
jgi:hypothetical protein